MGKASMMLFVWIDRQTKLDEESDDHVLDEVDEVDQHSEIDLEIQDQNAIVVDDRETIDDNLVATHDAVDRNIDLPRTHNVEDRQVDEENDDTDQEENKYLFFWMYIIWMLVQTKLFYVLIMQRLIITIEKKLFWMKQALVFVKTQRSPSWDKMVQENQQYLSWLWVSYPFVMEK